MTSTSPQGGSRWGRARQTRADAESRFAAPYTTELRSFDRGAALARRLRLPTRTGRRQCESKVRTAKLGGAMKGANDNLTAADLVPLPSTLAPHGLRGTFASVLCTLGEPPPVVIGEMGHTSPCWRSRSTPKR